MLRSILWVQSTHSRSTSIKTSFHSRMGEGRAQQRYTLFPQSVSSPRGGCCGKRSFISFSIAMINNYYQVFTKMFNRYDAACHEDKG
jgi:hypothetical protein